jgi:hypothetical protein
MEYVYAYAKVIVIIVPQKIKDFNKMRVLHLPPIIICNYGFLKNKIRSQQKNVQYGNVGNSCETSC